MTSLEVQLSNALAQRDQARQERDKAERERDELRNAMVWETNCLSCARLLDRLAFAEEQLKQKIASTEGRCVETSEPDRQAEGG